MRILHTSDWHIGHSLYNKKRYKEIESFFKWLVEVLISEEIDVLLVAGDIFDSPTPSNKSQELYYNFLSRVSKTRCQNVIITSGNHDSPSFLNAPKEILKSFNIHIIAYPSTDTQDELIILNNKKGDPSLIICAIPFLRDSDIRVAKTNESIEDKSANLIEGIQNHYYAVFKEAIKKHSIIKEKAKKQIPIIAMGHLFIDGGKTLLNDGVRNMYIGKLISISKDIFPDYIDYTALGHLHIPQKVGKLENIRYSGSPIPIGFNEAEQVKKVIIIDFTKAKANIKEVSIPYFQALAKITEKEISEILKRIEDLKRREDNIWLEVKYIGDDLSLNLREIISSAIEGSNIEILCIKRNHDTKNAIKILDPKETLENLDGEEIFNRYLDSKNIDKEDRVQLISTYRELITNLYNEDSNIE